MSSFLINLTRANEIGANSYYLNLDGYGLVLDAGMHPKHEGRSALPDLERTKNLPVDAIFVSHAHHDHLGALPLMMQYHPEARVFMGDATYFLADQILHNSVNVMKRQRLENGVIDYPLFQHVDVNKCVERWQACHLNQRWSLEGYPSKDKEEISFQFHHAGHILGSVAIEIVHKGRHIVYTGDINLSNQTVMSQAKLPEKDIDTLIIETTRGNHPTPPNFSRQGEVERLLQAINDTFDRNGAVMIPVFAMGKTQEALAILHMAFKNRQLPEVPVFIGGLGLNFTHVYDKILDSHQRLQCIPLLEHVKPKIFDGKKMSKLSIKKEHIYLISSGMMTENTLSNKLAQQMLSREQDSILFIGYADPESPAGRLKKTPRNERVILSKDYGDQPVLCNVESFDLTAHAAREDILAYIRKVNPRQCFLVHGEPESMEWFRAQLAESHPSMKVILPASSQQISL